MTLHERSVFWAHRAKYAKLKADIEAGRVLAEPRTVDTMVPERYYSAVSTKEITALWCHCEVCGHEWISRIKPERCAKCKRRTWDTGKETERLVRKGDQAATGERGETQRSSRVRGKEGVGERSPTGKPGAASGAGERSLAPPSHNPKTCRVYRCSQCVALGKTF